jgi:hypothetical protein
MTKPFLCRGKFILVGTLVFGFWTITCTVAQTGKEEDMAQVEKRKQMIKAAKEGLDNTTWQIRLQETTAKKKKKEVIKDTLYFRDGRIESERLTSEGFSPSNFTVRIKGEDNIIWETMQTSEENGLAFWRGEIRQSTKSPIVMRGVLSWHINEKTVQDYTFVSEEKEAIISEQVKKEEPTPTGQEQLAEEEVKKEEPTPTGQEQLEQTPETAVPSQQPPVEVEVEEMRKEMPEVQQVEPEKKQDKKKKWFWQR